MLPLCSTSPCSSPSLVLLIDGLPFLSRYQKEFEVRSLVGDKVAPGLSSRFYLHMSPFKKHSANSQYFDLLESPKLLTNEWSCLTRRTNEPFCVSAVSQKELIILKDNLAENIDTLGEATNQGIKSTVDNISESTAAAPDSFDLNVDSLTNSSASVESNPLDINGSTVDGVPDINSSIRGTVDMGADLLTNSSNGVEGFLSDMNESIGSSIKSGESAVNSTIDEVTSSITNTTKDVNEAIDKIINQVTSSIEHTRELTLNGLDNLSSDFREVSSKSGFIAVDLLRKAIVTVGDSLVKGTQLISYSYDSVKEFLPPEIKNGLVSFEQKEREISGPVGTAFQEAYSVIERLERSLGLDPSDPVVQFVLFLGTTTTLWIVFWGATYSGYAGDLSPNLALESLSGKENAILIDIRPEDLRERDGIPDLRRGARFRYANVYLPEIDDSLRRLVKSGRDLEDTLTAAIIRNLKTVGDRSKIIVMDADGTRSKSIARSLRKLGTMRSYRVEGGFQSWVKQGLRIKELKPETALTILNEEAEAILEDLSPSPVQLFGIGVGSIGALYALLEWEKSLQLIGVIGLGQTVYRRVASYEDPEDFKNDVRSLLAPVMLGAQAVSWAAGKLETNGVGLPVSPSSSEVQNRVLQAAAKHESQPSDTEGTPDLPSDSTSAAGESVDL